MAYLDLDRRFVSVTAEETAPWRVDSISWEGLLLEGCVVLLGEAWCGKTSEFEAQYRSLRGRGRFAFLVRCNQLVDRDLQRAMPLEDGEPFGRWLRGTSSAWLFLDGVDEMAGGTKSMPAVLRLLLDNIGEAGMQRTRIFISCRAGEWQGQADSDVLTQGLPPFRDVSPIDIDASSASRRPTVVRPEPLNEVQMSRLAAAEGLADATGLLEKLKRDGLTAYAERPGDFLQLVDYWRAHGDLGTYEEVVDNSINGRLAELSTTRMDDDKLSGRRARHGAERLAAIMCLAQKATIGTVGDDWRGSVDPNPVLDDWSDAERRSLLNRGVFVQSSVGRFQFHHVSSQRFLAAKWFDSLLRKGHPLNEILNVFFPTIFGTQSVASHLGEVAAWLAMWYTVFARELAVREPRFLLRPGFFSRIEEAAKDRAWSHYAESYERDDAIFAPVDEQDVILLGDPAIEKTVRRNWQNDTRGALRRRIMQVTQRGNLSQYRDLVREAALDRKGNEFLRAHAILAAVSLKDDTTLQRVVKDILVAERGTFGVFCRALSGALYPKYVSRLQLVRFLWQQELAVDEEKRMRNLLDALARTFRDQQTIVALINGFLDDLTAPAHWPDRRIRKIVADLVEPLTATAIVNLNGGRPSEAFHRLILRLQSNRHRPQPPTGPIGFVELEELTSANRWVNQRLVWAHVEQASLFPGVVSAKDLFEMRGDHLWRLGERDLQWLYDDLFHRAEARHRSMALSAIVAILGQSSAIFAQSGRLRELVASDAALTAQLFTDLRDALFDDWKGTEQELFARIERERIERYGVDQASEWEELRSFIRRDPSILLDESDRAKESLYETTRWLAHQTNLADDLAAASKHWQLLWDEIGSEGAEAYRDAVKAFWRRSMPGSDSGLDYWLRLIGFTVERSSDPHWADKLAADEVQRALVHLSDERLRYTPFLDDLLGARPKPTINAIRRVVAREWRVARSGPVPYLYHFATSETGIPPMLVPILLTLLTKHVTPTPGAFEIGIGILQRLAKVHSKRVLKFARLGVERHAGDAIEQLEKSTLASDERAVQYLLLALSAEAPIGIAMLRAWLMEAPQTIRSDLAEYLFGFLFGEHEIRQTSLIQSLRVNEIRTLLDVFLEHYDPGTGSLADRTAIRPGRSFESECHRSTRVLRASSVVDHFLRALFAKGGSDAYETLLELKGDARLAGRSPSPAAFAQGLIELQGMGDPWTITRFCDFEQRYPSIAKTGEDLHRIVLGVLDDLSADLALNDADIRPLLASVGRDEEKVQNWLMRELDISSRGRYQVGREGKVSAGNRPDIIVSIATAQVAIEVKQADSWSTSRLLTALNGQLADDYLLTKSRRHGVLVLTNHGGRTWAHPGTDALIGFDELVSFLQREADGLSRNRAGAIAVAVRGLDVSVEDKASANRRRSRRGSVRLIGDQF